MKIFIRGRPGAGKTTLVKKLLKTIKSPYAGFLTEEIREAGERVGFKIVTTDGREGILARKDFPSPYQVSGYGVNLEDFERVALPVLARASDQHVVIDEIGKMELFSGRFKKTITDLFARSDRSIIATIPICRLSFIEELIEKYQPRLFELETDNRERIGRELETLGNEAFRVTV
jgi:nucleoside-triphosphatase